MNTDKKPFLDSKLIENASLNLRACNHRFRVAILNVLNSEGPVDLPFLVEELGLSPEYVSEQVEFLSKAGLILSYPDGSYTINNAKLDVINYSLKVFATQ